MFLDTKASKLKVILNGYSASKVKVSLDTTGNNNKTSQFPRDEHSSIVWCKAHLSPMGIRVRQAPQGGALVIFWNPKRLSRAPALGGWQVINDK